MAGATLITALIARFPIFVWAGAALLGYIAAEMIITDPAVLGLLSANAPHLVVPDPAHPPTGLKPGGLIHYSAAALGALIVIVFGFALTRKTARADAR
jgi:predicted tellurium resistance membrane protein TerC